MGELEDFKAQNFKMYLETTGIALVQFMEDKQEMPYKAKCFINGSGTIGYAEVEIQDRHEFIFLSKTKLGEVLTLPGEPVGALPIKSPNIHSVWSVPTGSSIETILVAHVKCFGEEKPISEPDWLKEQVPKLPQKALDVAMVAMNELLSSLGGMDGLMETMGNMMSGVMEGLGKGMQEAFGGMNQREGRPQEAPPLEEGLSMEDLPDRPIPAKRPSEKKIPKARPKAPKTAAKKSKPKPKAKPIKKSKPKTKPKAKPKKKKK